MKIRCHGTTPATSRPTTTSGTARTLQIRAWGSGSVRLVGREQELAFGILPMYTRTPTNLAMTAAGIDYISGGRCVLGIGASGPQVIEGFHGVKYDAPVQRAREHVDICRKLWRREPSDYQGRYYSLPLTKDGGGSGLGKALKLIGHPVRERIPMLLAAIGPKNVELAAELFDEWQPILFHPGHVESAFGEALSAGDAKRDPSLGPLGRFDAGLMPLPSVRRMLFLASMISGGANCAATGNGRNKLKFPAAIPLSRSWPPSRF